jgi:5-methylcytosine-specific restriction endonuclease McrA
VRQDKGVSYTHDPMVTLHLDNLRFDCQDCHNAEHHGNDNAVTAFGLAFDMDGNLIKLY